MCHSYPVRDPHLLAALEHADDHHGLITQTRGFHELIEGHFESTTTVAEAFAYSTLGLGVAENLDGEIVSVDGQTWRIPADGSPKMAAPDLGLPFALAARGGESITWQMAPDSSLDGWPADIHQVMDAHVHDPLRMVLAIRIDGEFANVVLRSEHAQTPPYGTLEVALQHEVRFEFSTWTGSLVGFLFPAAVDLDVIPSLHLHAISDDRTSGGHCHAARVTSARTTAWVDDVVVRSDPTSEPASPK